MKSNDIAFAKGISSLFIVGTPLQILCMMDAIEEFQIIDYEIIVLFHPQEKRCNQVLTMLKDFNLVYQCFDYSVVRTRFLFWGNITTILNIDRKFDRVYIGDYNYLIYYLIGLYFIQKGGTFVCLDDGNNTIGALIGQKRQRNLLTKAYFLLRNLKMVVNRVNYEQYFYTLYSNIPTSKIIYPNNLSHIINKYFSNSIVGNNVYFIGTNPADYIPEYNITESYYYKILHKTLIDIRQQNIGKNLYYIPHGRDNSIETKNICQSNGFCFLELSCAVEYYFLREAIYPYSVTGFQSSALYNIKKMFPKSLVDNIFIKNVESCLFLEQTTTANLYSDIGINCKIIAFCERPNI